MACMLVHACWTATCFVVMQRHSETENVGCYVFTEHQPDFKLFLQNVLLLLRHRHFAPPCTGSLAVFLMMPGETAPPARLLRNASSFSLNINIILLE